MTEVATVSKIDTDALATLIEAGVLRPTYADFSKAIGPDDYNLYEAFGQMLARLHSATKFWIADWLNFGEGAFGERCAQAAEALGYSPRTMQDYLWVAQNVPRNARRIELSFSHHRAVARRKVDVAQRKELLDLAVRQNLTAEELAEEVKAISAPSESNPQWSNEPVDEALMKRALDRRTVVTAGYALVRRAKPIVGGGWQVDDESMARLRAAVGEE